MPKIIMGKTINYKETHICMNTRMHAHACTCKHPHMHAHMHACMHAHTNKYTCTHRHAKSTKLILDYGIKNQEIYFANKLQFLHAEYNRKK